MSEMTEHTEYLHRDCDRTIEELNRKLAALQSERDALMEAVEIYERLLPTPASGEPARKP